MPNNEIVNQLASAVLPQLIQLAAGLILHQQGSVNEAAQVLGRIGLPTDINITPEAFLAFVNSQKKLVQ